MNAHKNLLVGLLLLSPILANASTTILLTGQITAVDQSPSAVAAGATDLSLAFPIGTPFTVEATIADAATDSNDDPQVAFYRAATMTLDVGNGAYGYTGDAFVIVFNDQTFSGGAFDEYGVRAVQDGPAVGDARTTDILVSLFDASGHKLDSVDLAPPTSLDGFSRNLLSLSFRESRFPVSTVRGQIETLALVGTPAVPEPISALVFGGLGVATLLCRRDQQA